MDFKVNIGNLDGKSNWATWKYKILVLLRSFPRGEDIVNGKLSKPQEPSGVEEAAADSSADADSSDGCSPWENPRLTKDVYPVEYRLLIQPKISSGLMEGQIAIDIQVVKSTKVILIHQTNLTIVQTDLHTKSEFPKSLEIEETWAYVKNHYWIIKLVEPLEPGSYELLMTYKGTLSSNTTGFYKTTCTNDANEERSYALSYFEPTYARAAFPCFDEPSFRAVFRIKICHNAGGPNVALSNMCREKETPNWPFPGTNTVHFKPSPPMPPYLVALVVGDFAYTEPILNKNNVSLAVYSRPELIQYMKRAQELGIMVLDFLTSFFDVPFPLTKLDLIALPDFNIGGMENWGLITFREDCLLLNDESTYDDVFRVVKIIFHEISHMWFGNLVTIAWWDNLWLKEGFASYIEVFAGIKLLPEVFSDFLHSSQLLRALNMDAPLGSHPLVQTVNSTAEIREVFDAISYVKGSCLIRMLSDLDPEGFQAGIRSYLKKYQMSSTVTDNLWEELSQHVGYDIKSFMDTWTKQMGFPVILVNRCAGSRVTVSQSRFLQNKHATYDIDSSPFRYKWNVPIKYVTSKDLKNPKLIWLNKDLDSVALECEGSSEWVKVNWHQVGYYRVNYPLDQWKLFSLQLIRNHSVLGVEDRANLIDDAFNLASSGYFYYEVPLNLLRYFKFGKEKHFFPWYVATPYLEYIGARLNETEGYSSFMDFIHLLLKANLSENIWDFDDSIPLIQTKLQVTLINLACWSKEKEVLDKVKEMFIDWLDNKVLPHPELRSLVYSYGLSGDIPEEVWSKMVSHTLEEVTDIKENLSLWLALASVSNEEYLKSLIELAKDEKNLKSQNFFLVLNSMAKYPLGLKVVWDFMRNEWEYLVKRFSLENLAFSNSLYYICSKFGTEASLNEVKEFYMTNLKKPISVNHLHSIQRNIEWNSLFNCRLLEWIERYLIEETPPPEENNEEIDLEEVEPEAEDNAHYSSSSSDS